MERVNRHHRAWTQEEIAVLDDLLDEGHSLSRIAATLGRTVTAVKHKRMELGLEPPSARGVTMHEAARRLGVTIRTLKQFITQGWLAVRCPVRHDSCRRVIDDESMLEFLWDETHWHEIDPRWIADPKWQKWALEARGGLTFLTVDEVARLLSLTPATVQWRIRQGRIRAARTVSGAWMVRSDWLPAAMQPMTRSFRKRSFTVEEDAFLRLWRPFQPICHLAAALERSATGVRNRCLRLGLSGPVISQKERIYRPWRREPQKVA